MNFFGTIPCLILQKSVQAAQSSLHCTEWTMDLK
jgi:hypothetical protein